MLCQNADGELEGEIAFNYPEDKDNTTLCSDYWFPGTYDTDSFY